MRIGRRLIGIAACALAIAGLPARSHALFHISVIDEVLASLDGDPEQQFIEVEMLFAAQNLTKNAVLAAFDANGDYVEDILVLPGNVATGANGARWTAATSAFQSAHGFTADFTMPAKIPLGGGMVCWGAPGIAAPDPASWDHADPDNYVDCLAYGSYDGPTPDHVGTPTSLLAEGHSLVRRSETDDNAADFVCADTATPTNNAGTTVEVPATTACEAGPRASGIQITPDESGVLVNKDVGGERWTITRNLDGLTVTGNVFSTDGGPPLFLFCEQEDQQGENVVLSCSGADACSETACPPFAFIAQVTLPLAFFTPPASMAPAAAAIRDATAGARATTGPASAAGLVTRQSGVQITPDLARVLVSKDVGDERWSIARELASGTVTGNVFLTDGGAPLFLYCEQTGETTDAVQLTCSGADACTDTLCPAFEVLDDVELPKAFFAVPGDDPQPSTTPTPSSTPGPTDTPSSTVTPAPTDTPEPTETPEESETPDPDPTAQPGPSGTPYLYPY